MKRGKKTQKAEVPLRRRYCLMFGYDIENEDLTGYLGDDLKITENQADAKKFWSENYDNQEDFGTPEKWLEIVNEDRKLNHGYRFHLMRMREFRPRLESGSAAN